MTPVERLRAAIQQSGLSSSEYARTVLTRDSRTVRRWLSGESPIPEAVRRYLESLEPPGEASPIVANR